MTLHGEGPILDIAREVSRLIRQHSLQAGVIGGVAVVLHGHVRTTVDVDVFVPSSPEFAALLTTNGFHWDAQRREHLKDGVPVHLVTAAQLGTPPASFEDLDDVRTVSLRDLLSMKLRSGSRNPLRAQDLADVIALIRHHRLDGRFARCIDAAVRPEFKTIVEALSREARDQ